MKRLTTILAVVTFLLTIVVSSGAYAGGLFATGSETGVSTTLPLYSSSSTEQFATGELQFDAFYRSVNVWSYDNATGEYAGSYPTGMGAGNEVTLHFYPNINTRNLAVEAVAVGEAELAKKLAYAYDKKSKHFEFKAMDGLYPIGRDENNRFAGDIVLDDSVSEGSHVMRVYALVRDAKREDKAFFVLFRWSSKKPGMGLVDELRFRTEKWSANTVAPTPDYLTDLLARAGNGGTGQVFARLTAADKADADRACAEEAERTRVREAELARIESERAEASNAVAILSQHEARLGQIENAVNGHTDAIDALTTNQQTLATDSDANAQANADLAVRVGNLENWVDNATHPGDSPAQPRMVRFGILFTTSPAQNGMIIEVGSLHTLATAVWMSGTEDGVPYRGRIESGIARYFNTGVAEGTVMTFSAWKQGSSPQSHTIKVNQELEGKFLVVSVQ